MDDRSQDLWSSLVMSHKAVHVNRRKGHLWMPMDSVLYPSGTEAHDHILDCSMLSGCCPVPSPLDSSGRTGLGDEAGISRECCVATPPPTCYNRLQVRRQADFPEGNSGLQAPEHCPRHTADQCFWELWPPYVW